MRRALLLACLPFALGAATPPSVVVAPDLAHVGDVLSVSGCGYNAGRDVAVEIEPPAGNDIGFSTRVGPDGCFVSPTELAYRAPVAGTYEIYVYPKTGSGVGTYGHHKAIAETDLDVAA